ncbi:MAG: hypothetical protein IT292_01630 [Deltaproteobacteria bacterium]|nr:hypothetical protein [Deltaproteobacteria bacterium]
MDRTITQRIYAVALYALGRYSDIEIAENRQHQIDINDLLELGVDKINQGPGGVIHASLVDKRIILLPKVVTSDDCHAVYADLLNFFNNEKLISTWVVDCSTLTENHLLLLSNLIAYAHKLRLRGGDMLLCWFRSKFIPEQQREKISEFFHLKSIGGHMFSSKEEKQLLG